MKTERVHLRLGLDTITTADPWTVIEPVWWTGNIYDGIDEYEQSLSGFSLPQRHVYAVLWYRAEVCNGGHDQFFANSTGIVWKDTLDAFRAMKAGAFAWNLEDVVSKFPVVPPFDRDERNRVLDELEQDFDDNDERFYEADGESEVDAILSKYIRENPFDFEFEGTIDRPVRDRS